MDDIQEPFQCNHDPASAEYKITMYLPHNSHTPAVTLAMEEALDEIAGMQQMTSMSNAPTIRIGSFQMGDISMSSLAPYYPGEFLLSLLNLHSPPNAPFLIFKYSS